MQIHTSLKVKVFIVGYLVILILLSVVPAIVALKASTQLRTKQTGLQTWASTAFVWGSFLWPFWWRICAILQMGQKGADPSKKRGKGGI